jgi:general secretion pathway protein G
MILPNPSSHRARRAAGFTLIEMVLVLAIIALLVGGAIQLLGGVGDEAKRVRVKGDIQGVTSALTMYQSKALKYPTTEQGLRALVDRPSSAPVPREWSRMMDEVPLDPWGNEYYYYFPGKRNGASKFDIGSKGPDNIEGTDDDTGNWLQK